MEGNAFPFVNKESRLLANKVPKTTTLPPGMEVQVCGRVVSEPSRPVGMVENSIYAQTATFLSTGCRSTGIDALYKCHRPTTGAEGWEPDGDLPADRRVPNQ